MIDTPNTEREFAHVLTEALTEYGIDEVRTFDECGVLTSNTGLVVRVGEAEFQVTIVQSRHAFAPPSTHDVGGIDHPASCTCTIEDDGDPENGPHLTIDADENSPRHGRAAEPEHWSQSDAIDESYDAFVRATARAEADASVVGVWLACKPCGAVTRHDHGLCYRDERHPRSASVEGRLHGAQS